jgi:hypothetical protein
MKALVPGFHMLYRLSPDLKFQTMFTLPWASKRVPIFDRGTGSKPERLRSGSLQADLSLIV